MPPCRQLWRCLLVAVPVPVPLPERGARFHVTMPLHMIVMDGMVVRVGDVNYVIPIDTILWIQQSDGSSVLRVSAKSGQAMLEIGNQDHVPIHHLSGADVSGKVED